MSGLGYPPNSEWQAGRRPLLRGIVIAGVLAGPLVLVAFFAFSLTIEADVVPRQWSDIGNIVYATMTVSMIGLIPGLALCGLGTLLMRRVAPRGRHAGTLVAWMGAGAVIPLLVLLMLFQRPGLFAAPFFCFAGAVCAAICWHFERPSPRD